MPIIYSKEILIYIRPQNVDSCVSPVGLRLGESGTRVVRRFYTPLLHEERYNDEATDKESLETCLLEFACKPVHRGSINLPTVF